MARSKAPPRGETLKAVFFDLEGTLWDRDGCARHALDIILQQFSDVFPPDGADEVIARFNAVLLDQLSAEHLREERPFPRRKRFQALLDSYGIHRRGLAQKMSHLLDSARWLLLRQFLRDDALPVLKALRHRGLRRGVIVNGPPAVQRTLIQNLGLEPHLDHVLLAGIEGYRKPDARIFRRALEQAGAEPRETVHVGDSPITDLLGASRAGLRTVWFNTGRRRRPRDWPAPDFTISTLTELLSIV